VQSLSAAHVVLHVVAPQTYGVQASVWLPTHLPLPSQVPCVVAVEPAQLGPPQPTPDGDVHAVRLTPSQRATPHVGSVLDGAHEARLPCGVPTTGVQVPTLPATSQASHSPPHDDEQQTPSMQLLVVHCVPDVHACPSFWVQVPGFEPLHVPFGHAALPQQTLFTHVSPPEHCVLDAHGRPRPAFT
jgi:hypothetical protein